MRFLLLGCALVLVACNGHDRPGPHEPDPAGATSTTTAAPVVSVPGSSSPVATSSASSDAPSPKGSPGLADGAACNTSEECASGQCEGKGCGEKEGVCAPRDRRCLRDRRAYCGCDGVTFFGSGNCPGGRYERVGKCESTP